MIFSSPEFIFAFLPLVFAISLITKRFSKGPVAMLLWLTASSLFFYGFWKADYLVIIIISIVVNWLIGRWILACGKKNAIPLFIGVAANLLAIGYYKYFDFVTSTVNAAAGTELPELGILLPLGISFFTFQQIAYLADTAKGQVGKTNILEYAFFVSFFPQLIAGPIVHHRHILPTIRKDDAFGINSEQVLKGLHAFAIGFGKKVLLADTLAVAATVIFDAADAGKSLSMGDAILGTLSYTFQIYFDFSGYTDMAIGLGLMFGIQLPKNFNSPYKATSIIDFWRRWHITLSEFLREYVYIPLGGNRYGLPRRYLNLLSTMFIGGLWHGASWTFVAWGAAHGFLLMANHSIRKYIPAPKGKFAHHLFTLSSWAITFVIVALVWVAFRATTWSGMVEIYSSICTATISPSGTNVFEFDHDALRYPFAMNYMYWWAIGISALIAFFLPNTWRLMERFDEMRGIHRLGANLLTLVTFVASTYFLVYLSNRVTEFIYFNF